MVLLVPAVRGWVPVFQLLLIAGIALQGTMPAITWRLGRSDRYDDDPASMLDLNPGDWLVVVRDPHDAVRAHHSVFTVWCQTSGRRKGEWRRGHRACRE
ncbi:MAG: hypothetical protein ACLFRD_08940 [Nitriliruptoraceae bacterium]